MNKRNDNLSSEELAVLTDLNDIVVNINKMEQSWMYFEAKLNEQIWINSALLAKFNHLWSFIESEQMVEQYSAYRKSNKKESIEMS